MPLSYSSLELGAPVGIPSAQAPTDADIGNAVGAPAQSSFDSTQPTTVENQPSANTATGDLSSRDGQIPWYQNLHQSRSTHLAPQGGVARGDSDTESPTPTLHHGPVESVPVSVADVHHEKSHALRNDNGHAALRYNHMGDAEKGMGDLGMRPLQREESQPPAIGLFGGVAPSGVDAEEGLRAVRSRKEEDERETKREETGPDPWAVKFEPGEKANPKVSLEIRQ
jgi:hypothetical protein